MNWTKFFIKLLSRKFMILAIWLLSGAVLLGMGVKIDDILAYYKATGTPVASYIFAEAGVDGLASLGKGLGSGTEKEKEDG